MAGDTSDVTGEAFYSGSFKKVKEVLRALNLGGGKLGGGGTAQLSMETVNSYQENVDREIDDLLSEVYHVPLRSMNQVQPDGSTKRVFPGSIRYLAIYWTAGLILRNEFQDLGANENQIATSYIEESRRQLFNLRRPNQFLVGQERKSNISRTLPPTMQPPDFTEANF